MLWHLPKCHSELSEETVWVGRRPDRAPPTPIPPLRFAQGRDDMKMKSLQETYAPNNRCFGCGPANEKGLRIRSFEAGGELAGEWHAEPHHQAFDGILNG